MNTRALKNPYPDYDGNPALTQHLFDSQGKLTPEFGQRLSSKVSELLAVMENGLRTPDPDGSCYTGWTGIALLYLHLHSVFREPLFLEKANMYISYSLKSFRQHQDFTFLCGVAGALAVAAVVCHRLQRPQNSDEYISRLLQQHPTVVQPSAELSDELLYGRIGYLYSLVYINQQLGQEKIPLQYIREVSKAVAASGERLSRTLRIQNQSPLMYEWYQERYVGAAHGLAGIYYFLMQPGLAHSEEVVHRLVKPSVDYVCSLKFPSGNYPPCVGDERDLLVHWCHGAPGVVYMLLQAHRVFGDPRYLGDALTCGEVVWKWGLLKKGYGLCHGAAGNAYAFLALYRHTQDAKHLYRACMFADWCMNYGTHGCRTPDRPFSLFEGMAGTIYFLADLLRPMEARFPAFEL